MPAPATSHASAVALEPTPPAAPPLAAAPRNLRLQAIPWFQARPGLLLIPIAGLALALRLVMLGDVPRFTDETEEMLSAYAVATGQAYPLTITYGYLGVLLTYLVAPVLALFGPRLELARLVVALFGVATLLPTYLLGRRLGGPWAGLIAATLLAVSAPQILVGRVAYSHSITPFFAVLAAWLLLRAVEDRHGPSLAAAGLAGGLALQTHPTVAVMLPGGLLYLLMRGRALLVSRWALLAAAGGLLALSNLVLHNLLTGGGSLLAAARKSEIYGRSDDALPVLLTNGVHLLSGIMSNADFPPLDSPLVTPAAVLIVSLVAASLLFCARRGQLLPLLLVLSMVLIFPTFSSRFQSVLMRGRYLMPLLPICLAATGAALVALARLRWRFGPRPLQLLAAVVALGVAAWHLHAFQTYLATAVAEGITNERYYQAAATLLAAAPDDTVLLDPRLDDEPTMVGGGKVGKVMRYFMLTNGLRYRTVDHPARVRGVAGETRLALVHTSSLAEIDSSIRVTPLYPALDEPKGARFGVYLLQYSPAHS